LSGGWSAFLPIQETFTPGAACPQRFELLPETITAKKRIRHSIS
jgi:hypothetical protein